MLISRLIAQGALFLVSAKSGKLIVKLKQPPHCNVRPQDSGSYRHGPSNADSTSVVVHVL
ncbi:unnamed protein product, partial [Ixodes hexagonus]